MGPASTKEIKEETTIKRFNRGEKIQNNNNNNQSAPIG